MISLHYKTNGGDPNINHIGNPPLLGDKWIPNNIYC